MTSDIFLTGLLLWFPSGPMDTEMQRDIQRLTGTTYHLLPCKEPAAKLIKLLLDNNFLSGTHLDFFEVWYEFKGELQHFLCVYAIGVDGNWSQLKK